MVLCERCGMEAAARAVRILPNGWGGSPDNYLGGPFWALDRLRKAGVVEKTLTGWYKPLPGFPWSMVNQQ